MVIAKIPFAVPDSPLEAALAEWVEAQGRNPFMEISVPGQFADNALQLIMDFPSQCERMRRSGHPEDTRGRQAVLITLFFHFAEANKSPQQTHLGCWRNRIQKRRNVLEPGSPVLHQMM